MFTNYCLYNVYTGDGAALEWLRLSPHSRKVLGLKRPADWGLSVHFACSPLSVSAWVSSLRHEDWVN